MIVPLDWLKEYVDTNKTPDEIAEIFTALGLMLDKPIQNGVLDLEHRMDRADWLSIIGCARDYAAFEGLELRLPETYTEEGKDNGNVDIQIKCPELVKRFNTRVIRGLTVKPSPEWLKKRLTGYGIPSINNVVDITNYVMVEFGQPMHAQDLAKFDKEEIVIRMAKNGEVITTLDGTKVELSPDIFVLTQNDIPTAIGGIVGGKDTGVTDTTTDIVLDAGTYDHAYIRRTSRKLKIQNETVQRYNKFLHPKLTEIALARAVKLILELAGGEYYENEDYYPKKTPITEMAFRIARLQKISGMIFDTAGVKEILKRLGYKVIKESGSGEATVFELEVPYFRTDVLVEDDVVSDILRINGYANIPVAPIASPPPEEITSDIYTFEEELGNVLTRLGLHEHITSPLVKHDPENANQVPLENSLNSEMNALRTSIRQTLMPVTEYYAKHGYEKAELFETGKVYSVDNDGDNLDDYIETRVVEIVRAGGNSPKDNNDELKKLVAGMLENLGIADVDYRKGDDCAEIYQQDLFLGELSIDSARFYTENLLKADKSVLRVKDRHVNFVIEDLTFVVGLDIAAGPIILEIGSFSDDVANVVFVDEFIEPENNSRALTFRLYFKQSDTVQEVKKKIVEHLETSFGITFKK